MWKKEIEKSQKKNILKKQTLKTDIKKIENLSRKTSHYF